VTSCFFFPSLRLLKFHSRFSGLIQILHVFSPRFCSPPPRIFTKDQPRLRLGLTVLVASGSQQDTTFIPPPFSIFSLTLLRMNRRVAPPSVFSPISYPVFFFLSPCFIKRFRCSPIAARFNPPPWRDVDGLPTTSSPPSSFHCSTSRDPVAICF